MKRELVLGCGRVRVPSLISQGAKFYEDPTFLDINPDHKPHVVHDMTKLPLPFEDNSFDEVHAYEVLEHTGTQGDYHFFFAQFSDFWRILKPKGSLYVSVPMLDSPWAWGDPSHTRVFPPEFLIFLDQSQYTAQIGVTAMSDFRYIYQADFREVWMKKVPRDTFTFILEAVKPSRITRRQPSPTL